MVAKTEYPIEVKVEVIREVLSGALTLELARKKLGINNSYQIQSWIGQAVLGVGQVGRRYRLEPDSDEKGWKIVAVRNEIDLPPPKRTQAVLAKLDRLMKKAKARRKDET